MMSESHVRAVETAHRIADDLFAAYPTQFGAAQCAYRGHVHRDIGLVGLQIDLDMEDAALLGVAAFFHDAGIWLDRTFDYLSPSIGRALDHLGSVNPSDDAVVRATIMEHHRLRRARSSHPMVEAFRRADLTDLSGGLVPSPGVSFRDYQDLAKRYRSCRFRWQLTAIFLRWVVRHPLRPLPMVKW
jgi:hypothetical protein